MRKRPVEWLEKQLDVADKDKFFGRFVLELRAGKVVLLRKEEVIKSTEFTEF